MQGLEKPTRALHRRACPDARERAGPVFPPPPHSPVWGEETQAQRARARRDNHRAKLPIRTQARARLVPQISASCGFCHARAHDPITAELFGLAKSNKAGWDLARSRVFTHLVNLKSKG